ncbi:hypothetical protein Tco_0430798 [Tanacetum coccineum]
MHVTRQGTNDVMTPESIQAMIDRAIQRNSTQDDGSQSLGGGIRRPVQPHDAAYAMTWGTFKKKLTAKYCPNGEIKKLKIELWNLEGLIGRKHVAASLSYISGWTSRITFSGNVMSARPKTLDFAIELANDLMDQKLCTYAERQNENKRKADDSSRNHHQQQPRKKQNVARAYCWPWHMRRDCPKLKNHRNGNGNGTAKESLALEEEM